MKVARLAEMIVEATRPTPGIWLTVDHVCASLNFKGPFNQHLAFPWEQRVAADRQRPTPLTGCEDISGDLLLFSYTYSNGDMTLHEIPTLADADHWILSDGGILNRFASAMLVFDHFRLRPYKVTYRSPSGSPEVLDMTKERSHLWTYDRLERRLEWL